MTTEPLFQRPYLIQRMGARSKNNQVRFGERYILEYMGASEFERGVMSKTLQRMDGHVDSGSFELDGITIYLAWDRRNYNQVGAQQVIEGLWRNQFRTKEWTNFTALDYNKQQEAVKQMRLAPIKRQLEYTDAWFDIDHGLFWTWQKINPKDIALNIAHSAKWLALTDEERHAAMHETKGVATLRAKLGPLREQLVNSGRLTPRQ